MARKTDGEKIDELQQLGAALTERVNTAFKELEATGKAHSETVKALADLRREFEKETAVLKRDIESLKKWNDDQKREREEVSRKLWAFGPNALGAVINGLIAAAVAYLIARR